MSALLDDEYPSYRENYYAENKRQNQ